MKMYSVSIGGDHSTEREFDTPLEVAIYLEYLEEDASNPDFWEAKNEGVRVFDNYNFVEVNQEWLRKHG